MMVKKFLILNLIIFSSSAGFSQRAVETKSLFKQEENEGLYISTFYGEISPSTAWTTLNNTAGKASIIQFGIHVNRKVAIGFYVSRSPNTNVINVPVSGDPEYQEWIDAGARLDQLPPGQSQAFAYFSHKGLDLSYMYKPEKTIFPRGGFKFGSGVIQLTAEKRQLFQFFPTIVYTTKLIDFNPEIGLGVNLTNWWRLHADVGYHFVFSTKEEVRLDPEKFDGGTLRIGFAFGAFNK